MTLPFHPDSYRERIHEKTPMLKRYLHITLFFVLSAQLACAQTDSITVRAHPGYDSVTHMHRALFGQNFRKEWAAATTLPIIKLSDKGLTPLQLGGGHQTHSLRLKDATGKEWVLRSIEKYPEIL